MVFKEKNLWQLLCFLVLLNNNSVLGNDNQYLFLKNIATSISLASRGKDLYWDQTLIEKLNLEERRSLCISAQKNASFPTFDKNHHIFKAQLYNVRYPGQYEDTALIAIDCRSYPSTYLGYLINGVYSNRVVSIEMILLEDSGYTFKVETATSMELWNNSTQNEDIENEWRSHHFQQLDPEDRWNLCSSARNHIQMNVRFTNSLEKSKLDDIPPRIFQIDSTSLDVFVKCRTTPPMYLGLKRSTTNVVKIVFIESDLKEHGYYD